MNVDKELIALDKAHKKVNIKYGQKFKDFYDTTIDRIVRADKAIVNLTDQRKKSVALADDLMTALAITETEV